MVKMGAKLFPVFAVAALVSAFLVVTLGGIVRVTGSGLGCPDWPTCYGQIIPPWDLAAWIEYIHRLSAATSSIFTVAMAITAFARYSDNRRELLLALTPIVLLIGQIVLGALNVIMELPPAITLMHTMVAMSFVGTLALVVGNTPWPARLSQGFRDALTGSPARAPSPGGGPASSARVVGTYRTATSLLALAAFLTVLAGSAVTRSGASLACDAFPLCGSAATSPTHEFLQWLQMLHRGAALVVTLVSIWVLSLTWRLPVPKWLAVVLRTWAIVITVLIGIQIALGVTNVLLLLPMWSRAGHLTNAAILFAIAMLLVGIVWRGTRGLPIESDVEASEAPPRGVWQTLMAYFWLMKPNIIVLLLVTTVAAMLAAGGRSLSSWLVLTTLIGGFLCAGGANAMNSYLDYDIDGQMRRTRWRPLPTGRLDRTSAFRFAVVVSVLSILVFYWFVNLISAVLAAVALFYYVVVYSAWLKRRSIHNIVIGGAAGAFPPVIGWTAVTGEIDFAAIAMFLIIFFWTPPHAWALTLLAKDDYQRVHVPMLPVVHGEAETRRQILLYSFLLVAVTLLPAGLRVFGLFYLAAAVVLGAIFLVYAINLYRAPSMERVRQVYKYSSLYLALFFAALVVDTNIG